MANTKSITNKKDEAVEDMLEGIQHAYPGLLVQTDLRIVMLNRERKNRVGLISGGGSGHEPFAAGFVGEGMLTAAVAGKVFASPPIGNIVAAILSVANLNKGGVLLIVMNYTGDILNFSAAMEVARTKGHNVDSIIVSDDVAQFGQDSKSLAGRRGLVGVLLISKIVGGYSKKGKPLNDLAAIGQSVNERLGTFGVTFESCTMPGEDKPLFNIPDDKVEFGMGIHGEAGIARIDMSPLKELVKEMLSKITACLILEENAKVVVVVNNLGALSQMELSIISKEVYCQIEGLKYKIVRFYVGTFVTSLNTRGFQICILNLTNQTHWLPYLDEETEAFAWPGKRISYFNKDFPQRIQKVDSESKVLLTEGMKLNNEQGELFRKCLKEICKTLLDESEYLNLLDTEVGDADCGTTLARFAKGIQQNLHDLPVNNVPTTLAMLSKLADELMGGTLGAFFALMLLGAAKQCYSWESCWSAAIEMIQKYSRAQLGDRTFLDALIPACEGFKVHIKENGHHCWSAALRTALEHAEEGCKATKTMTAKAGRASYVDPSKITAVDAGAHAVMLILRAIVKTLVGQEDVSSSQK